MAKEQISVVVHCTARNIIRNPGGMLELCHFRPLERSRVKAPHYALKLFAGAGHWIEFRITPAGSDVVELAIAPESQPAAVVCEHINREAGVARLGCWSKILNSRPVSFIQPDAHQVRIRTPSGSINTFAIGRGRYVIKHTVPAGLVIRIMGQQT